MPHDAVVTFTARNLQCILDDGGSRDWRLDADRARHCEFLVCTQNRNNAGFGAPTAGHGHAFLIGRISGVVPSSDRPDRWLIKISEYVACDIPNIWGKLGHLRYPVWYTTLEDLGINLGALPPFEKLPSRGHASGLSDVAGPPPIPPKEWPTKAWTAMRPARVPASAAGRAPSHPTLPGGQDGADGQEAWARLDAILAQLDRVPDLPATADPLDWDAQGLPR
jgi:hypothetical protein